MEAFGFMLHLAQALGPETISWLKPTLLGQTDPNAALLPYWLGAWGILLSPSFVPLDFAARLPFIGLLFLTLAATWYGVYALARTPSAQPVTFAFGGEAKPKDYACALADGGLLALLACLGLARLSHETTPALSQLCLAALLFFGLATLPRHRLQSAIAIATGMLTRVLLGDLTFLHDAGSLAIDREGPELNIQLVVGNDGGGSIFESLEMRQSLKDREFERLFRTPQNVNIAALAVAYGWLHVSVENDTQLANALKLEGRVVIEVKL